MELDWKVAFLHWMFGSGRPRTGRHFQLALRAHLIYLLATWKESSERAANGESHPARMRYYWQSDGYKTMRRRYIVMDYH